MPAFDMILCICHNKYKLVNTRSRYVHECMQLPKRGSGGITVMHLRPYNLIKPLANWRMAKGDAEVDDGAWIVLWIR